MSTRKKTTKTINRRSRHIQKQVSKFSEISPSKSSSLESFRPSRRVKKGGIKYEEKPTSRETKVDQKVKNWRQKQILKKETDKPHACKKCGGWRAENICRCNWIKKISSRELIQEVNRRLISKELKFETKPLIKKKTR